MPAPTALKRAEDTPLATDVPLPVEGKTFPKPTMPYVLTSRAENDEEFLLDAPDSLPTDANAVVPVEQDSDEMAIDEEGRPRFAPAQDIVRSS